MAAVPMIELWRGGMCESSHVGHAVICNDAGEVVQAWGDPAAVIFPRSACKMVQALPLIESGAADAAGLTERQVAFSCASHIGAAIHRQAAADWLAGLGLSEADLRCGAHEPHDTTERARLAVDHEAPCQLHNNCSGKHSGFLTMNRHLRGGPEYTEIDHPLQVAIRQAFVEATGEDSPAWGIDGCSAPNFATSVTGLARAMGRFAGARDTGDLRSRAMHRLTRAMADYPEMISGNGGTCTELMRAMGGRVTLKAGAEGVYVAILPDQRLGVALKIVDGSDRAKDAAITALLIALGVLDTDHPAARRWLTGPQRNWRGLEAARLHTAPGFPA